MPILKIAPHANGEVARRGAGGIGGCIDQAAESLGAQATVSDLANAETSTPAADGAPAVRRHSG